MKRDWSGCERRRYLRPPSQIPSAAQRSRSGVYPAFGPALQRHVRTRPSRSGFTNPRRHTPGCRSRCRLDSASPSIRAKRTCPKLLTIGCRPPDGQPPCPRRCGRSSGSSRITGGPREAGSRGVGLRPGKGGRLPPPGRAPVKATPAIRLPVQASHSPTCGLQPRGAPPGRHGATWRASPGYRGQSPSCRASYRRRHMGCPS